VVPTRTAALDFKPVHVHGCVEKAASAFDTAKGTLSGASSSIAQSALTIANYSCLAHDILAILVLWMATAIRGIDANGDRSLAVIANAIVTAILESSRCCRAVFTHPPSGFRALIPSTSSFQASRGRVMGGKATTQAREGPTLGTTFNVGENAEIEISIYRD
jgi:hypothetical protein